MIRVDVWLPDPAAALATGAFGAGALIRIERAATVGGVYAEVTTLPLVATTLSYTYWDPTGDGTQWYRWRVSNSGNTVRSPYSAPFQGTSPTDSVFPLSYAGIADVLALFETTPLPAKQARLATLLGVATNEIITECGGRDYFLHPSDGSSEAWFADTSRTRRGRDGRPFICAHYGIVSLEQLEFSQDQGGTYAVVDEDDYVLRGDDPDSAEPPPAGEPYFHILLTGTGTVTSVPRGTNLVRPTGIRGWPAIPSVLVEATAERARQLAYADPSYSGNVPGEDAYGGGPLPMRWPQTLYNFLTAERHRFWCQV